MRGIRLMVPIVVAVLSISGCIWTPISLDKDKHTDGKPIDDALVAKIKKGETKSEDVVALFGGPTVITPAGQNELYVYRYCETGGTTVGILGLYDTESSKQKCDELTVIIDTATGIVADYQLVRQTKQ